jgi:polar amino acid transport system permease protein
MDTPISAASAGVIERRRRPGDWITLLLAALVVYGLVKFLVFNPNWNWPVVWSYLFSDSILTGLGHTLLLTVVTALFGVPLGVLITCCRVSSYPALRVMAAAFIWLVRAIPPLVMLLFFYFIGALVPRLGVGLPFGPTWFELPMNDLITQFTAATVGLSVYLGCYTSEVFRSGVLSVPTGQVEACRALGLPPLTAYRKVLGPQITRVILPPLASEMISIFKATSLVTVIGYTELLTTVQHIYVRNFETIPLLAVAVIWYLVLTTLAMWGQAVLEKRFGRGFGPRKSTASWFRRAVAATPDRKESREKLATTSS